MNCHSNCRLLMGENYARIKERSTARQFWMSLYFYRHRYRITSVHRPRRALRHLITRYVRPTRMHTRADYRMVMCSPPLATLRDRPKESGWTRLDFAARNRRVARSTCLSFFLPARSWISRWTEISRDSSRFRITPAQTYKAISQAMNLI